MINKLMIGLMILILANVALGRGTVVPAGTVVYGELDQRVTSKKKETSVGDIVRASAWRDVVVNGHLVIEAGAPLALRVAHMQKARFAGMKGKLELEAISVRAIDGTQILLDGGYDKSGHGRKALSISLAAVVAWPLVFIKGKQAVLPSGTVFDSTVQVDKSVGAAGGSVRRVKIGRDDAMTVDVLYDTMNSDSKQRSLPVRIRQCSGSLELASVVTVNEKTIEPIPLQLSPTMKDGGCMVAEGALDLEALGEHFTKGINRFVIESSGNRAEVILDIEL